MPDITQTRSSFLKYIPPNWHVLQLDQLDSNWIQLKMTNTKADRPGFHEIDTSVNYKSTCKSPKRHLWVGDFRDEINTYMDLRCVRPYGTTWLAQHNFPAKDSSWLRDARFRCRKVCCKPHSSDSFSGFKVRRPVMVLIWMPRNTNCWHGSKTFFLEALSHVGYLD